MNTARLVILSAVLAFATTAAYAQWCDDPFENLPICCRPDEQVQPKVAPAKDGGWYLSWFDNDPNGSPPYGYDVYLQRYDARGVAQWAHGALLVADRGLSWTTDYDLVVDRSGNAILAFNEDCDDGSSVLTVTKIAPDGSRPWGPAGVQLGREGNEQLTPRLVLTTDDHIVVAYQDGRDVAVERLDDRGTSRWVRIIPSPAYRSYLIAESTASDNGSVIVSFTFNGLQTPVGPIIHLLANKFSADGVPLWDDIGVTVYNAGFLEPAQFPPVFSDGRGGAVFVFHTIYPLAEVYAQRITREGVRAWSAKGVPVATEPTRVRAQQSATFDPATGETTVFYIDELYGTAIAGQRFDLRGRRLWTDAGLIVRPFEWINMGFVQSARHGETLMVYWMETPDGWPPEGTLYGARVGSDGTLLCEPFPVSTGGPQRNVALGMDAAGMSVLAWLDGRNDAGDVYAQNVNADCTLGPPAE